MTSLSLSLSAHNLPFVFHFLPNKIFSLLYDLQGPTWSSPGNSWLHLLPCSPAHSSSDPLPSLCFPNSLDTFLPHSPFLWCFLCWDLLPPMTLFHFIQISAEVSGRISPIIFSKNGILCDFLLFYPGLLILIILIPTFHHVSHLLTCLFSFSPP